MTNSAASTMRGMALAALMNGAQHVGQEPAAAEDDAEHHAGERADARTRATASSSVYRDLRPDRALCGAGREPLDQLVPDRRSASSRRTGRSSRSRPAPSCRATPTTSSDTDDVASPAKPARRAAVTGLRRSRSSRLVGPWPSTSHAALPAAPSRVRSRPRRAATPRSPGRCSRNSGVRRISSTSRGRSSGTSNEPFTVAGPAVMTTTRSAERDGLLQVVRHEDHRGLAARPQPQQLVLHEAAGLHVERGERLVHEQDRRLVDERLGERDALAHAAGELVRVVVLEPAEPDPVDPVPAFARASAFVAPR